MEFNSSHIARLVLGYLKTEKCQLAFDAFYKTSPHFQCSNKNKIRTKYIVTRVLGNSLYDYLHEYTQIYNLIQERLEPTDYYEENSSRNIIDQLLYLLDKCGSTRQNTPLGSRSSTPVKEVNKSRCLFNQNLSVIEEHITPELNTTPLEALPGNSLEYNAPRRKGGLKTNKNTAVEESDSGDSPDNCQDNEDLEVLRQTFLEHPELHEKIAENINLVINTTETTKTAEEKLANEIDTAVKAIVDITEADPIFEKLIGDLIGSRIDNDEVDQHIQQPNYSAPERREQLSSNTQKTPSTKELETEDDALRDRLRSARKQPSPLVIENTSDVNTDDIKSSSSKDIVSNENIPKIVNSKQIGSGKVDFHENLRVNTNSGDIILYDGTLDNYMKNTATTVVSQSNPLFYNNNLLMVQPGLIQQTSVTTPLVTGLQVDKPLYVLNSSQLINVSVPQYKINNVTEQDILTMPTVIVCDDNRQPVKTQPPAVPSNPREPKKILPKQSTESSLSEYLTLYKSSKDCIHESKFQTKKKELSNTIKIEVLKQPEADKLPLKEEDVKIVDDKQVTPRAVTPETVKQTAKKATPKSGSHVRALDFNFNTPSHTSLSAKKKCTTPKSSRKKSPGKTLSTKISKSLFGSPSKGIKTENISHETQSKEEKSIKIEEKEKKLSSWDADLRALMGPVKDPSPKKKKKDYGKRVSKKPKVNLNNTESDAKIIEESLKQMDLEVNTCNTENDVKVEIKEDSKKDDISTKTIEEVQEELEAVNEEEQEFSVALINCNSKSRCKKKCNIDNNISKSVKITKVKEIKSLEIIPDTNNKLILSPSKLNANKRTLVDNTDKEVIIVKEPESLVMEPTKEVEIKDMDMKQKSHEQIITETNNTEVSSEIVKDAVEDSKKDVAEENTKFVTPEMAKNSVIHPITANRNLTPMLETPIKTNSIPKTPGKYLPTEINETPITKLLNEQLRDVDILSIETPSFPLTPNFPFTPFNTKSPYPNRPTDYSSTSSYYQPSDSDQNKSFEALVEECKRLESRDFKTEPPTTIVSEKTEKKDIENNIQTTMSEKISSFNQNIIARKNLSLVKEDLENSSSESISSDGDSSGCSDGYTDSSDSLFNKSMNTVVETKTDSSRYSLRPRKKEETNITMTEKVETVQDIITQTEVKPELKENSTVISKKDALLKEIEEKRMRTIAKIKQVEKPTPTQTKRKTPVEKTPRKVKKPLPNRNSSGKFIKTKTPPLKTSIIPKKNKRKSKSPVKLSKKSTIKTTISDNSKDVMLHISSDDDNIKPFDVVETELLESPSGTNHPLNTFQKALDTLKSNLKPKEICDNSSDEEAATLVEGLKERGIYLVPNKTPRKQSKPSQPNYDNDKESLKLNLEKEITVESEIEGNKINSTKIEIDTELKCVKEFTIIDTMNPKDVKISSNETKIDKKESLTNTDGITKTLNKTNKHKSSNDQSKIDGATDKLRKTIVKEDSVVNSKKAEVNIDNSVKVDTKSHTSNKNNKTSKSTSKSNSNQSKKTDNREQKSTKTESSKNKKSTKKDDDLKKPKNAPLNIKSKENNSSLLKEASSLCNIEKERLYDVAQDLNLTDSPLCNIEKEILYDVAQDLNLTDSISEEVFDNKLFAGETLKIEYDPSKTSGKTLADYKLSITNHCTIVEVFGEQIEITVTPFKTILDIPEKNSCNKVKILQNTLIAPSKTSLTKIDTISPLENLYSNSPPRYQSTKVHKLKCIDRRRNSVDQKYDSQPKSKRSTRSKSVDHNALQTLYKEYQNENTSEKREECQKVVDKKEDITNEDIKKTQVGDIHDAAQISKPSPKAIDDDLMNYAICGSEREENDTDDSSRLSKRKPKDELEGMPAKKFKYQELLSTLNVDMFLTQLHGGDN